ncbi:MAG: glycosyltransferase family 2 protein [Bacteroidales bacterium]|nr:glycosyltransferase family 2 protein [Bacteroidales bacterium]
MPLVSIVIVCMNRPDNLYPCLESIRHYTGVPHEIFVVAYLFDKAALAKLKEEFPDVNFIESDEIRGFAENNNLAFPLTKGRYILCLNDDTCLFFPTIDKLANDFKLLPEDAALLSPRIEYPDGQVQTCGRPVQTAQKYILSRYHLGAPDGDDTLGRKPFKNALFRTSDINGACFLIRRDIFEQLGWLDERYFFTPEDIALSTLAREKGYSVWVDADASVIHYHQQTAGRLVTATRPAGMRGYLMFHSHGSTLRYGAIGLAVALAEAGKWTLSGLKLVLGSGNKHLRTQHTVYSHNLRSIFTRRSPKEIFIRYYEALRRADTPSA